ncbi:MAG: cytochrome P450 [Sneathiellales bacterium]|nr:cytochrome P450 [Sneathiellales bacterium]
MAKEIPLNDTVTLSMLDKDPYPVYQELRRTTPLVRLQAIDRVILTKARDTHYVKTTPDLFGSHDTTTPMQRAFRGHTLMRKDGEAHLRERSAMVPPLSLDTITNEWTSVLTLIAHDFISELPRGDTLDLKTAFAEPLAARSLARLLGLDSASNEDLLEWAPALIQGAMNAARDEAVFARSDQANDAMDACFRSNMERFLQAPNSSVLSHMTHMSDPLPFSQIGTNLRICIGGGLVETRDGLLTTLYGLLGNPDQLEDCMSKAKWKAACEEGLRWVAPIQTSPRIVLEDTEICGYPLEKGQTILAAQASANRDEDLWKDPEKFDINRTLIRHQSFGDGAHNCLGQNIYRVFISAIVLPMLFDRFPKLTLAPSETVQFRGFGFRGPENLPVTLN